MFSVIVCCGRHNPFFCFQKIIRKFKKLLDKCTKPYYNIITKSYKGDPIMKPETRELDNIFASIDNTYREAAKRLAITDTEMDILYVINLEGSGCNQSCLYKQTGLTKSTVNSALHKMQERGEIELISGEGRNVCVRLTDKGRVLSERTVCRLIAFEEEVFGEWTQEEWELFISLNRRFLEQFRKKVESL